MTLQCVGAVGLFLVLVKRRVSLLGAIHPKSQVESSLGTVSSCGEGLFLGIVEQV